MSRYKPYPSYKDSGVEWIGQIPEHWTVSAVKREFDAQLGKMLQPEARDHEDVLVPYHKAVSVQWENVSEDAPEKMWASSADKQKFGIKKGDLLICEGGDVGRAAIFNGDDLEPVIIQNSLHRVRPKKNNKPILLLRLMQVLKRSEWFDVLCSKSTIVHFTAEKLGDLPYLIAPENEQDEIIARIERETTRIDALIAKKTRFIELLKEKRQALITHAVTKGLNPNVKMKDSGVEWIGEVPEHWECGALGYYSTIKTGGTPDRKDEEYWGGNIPWVKTGEVNYREIYDSEEKITEEGLANSSAQISPPGTILMAMYGMGVTRGRVAMLAKSCAYNQACAAISCSTLLANTYLYTCLEAAYNAIRDLGNEASQINLNIEIISKIKIPVPPLVEQSAIVQKVRFGLSKVDTLIQQTDKSIDLLKERRSAFITAAVTGQIDLRSEVNE